MRSLLITYDFPPIVSGIATVFYNIWKSLPADQCLVLAPRVRGSLEFDRANGIQVVRKKYSLETDIIKKFLSAILLFVHTMRITRKEKIDLLICGQPMIIGAVGLIFRKLFNMPYHVWVYGGETIKFKDSKLFLKMLKCILDNADRVITNSSYTDEEYSRFGIPDEKLLKVTPGVDADQFRPDMDVRDLVKKHDLENRRVIMTVGRLVPRKGNDTVIRSLKKVVEKIPDIRYVIIGNGPEKKRLQMLAHELHLEDHIVFAGFVSDEDLPKYYNACDLYVLPNRETDGFEAVEGFGISFIEAGACGKPVIGGRSGGTSDSVLNGETGVLIDPLDTELLADQIIQILSDRELAGSYGMKGRERVMKDFRWEMISKTVGGVLSDYGKVYVN